jgi:hypothetical protein
MAWTDIEIANVALVRMGLHKQIASLPDNSSEGKALAVLLPRIKERVLSAYDWSWALVHAELAERTLAGDVPFGWTYAYEVPVDFARPVRLFDGDRRPPVENRLAFQVATVEAKTSLLTDIEDAALIYVSNAWLSGTVSAPSEVDDVAAWLLAAELAMPLAKRADLSGYLANQAKLELLRAVSLDKGRAASDPEPMPARLRARS